MSSLNPRPSRSEQRDAAREKARQMREMNQKKEKRSRLILQLSVVSVAVVILGAIGLFVVNEAQRQANAPVVGDSPANMTFESGIKIGVGLQAFTATKTPTPDAEGPVPNIKIYVDYLCPICQAFDVPNSAQIRSWVDTGAATVEFHPISFLDRASLNEYSSRAANAAACVANYEPDSFFDFHTLLMERQPSEGGEGQSNAELADYAAEAGAGSSDVAACIDNKSFGNWVAQNTEKVLNTPLADSGIQVSGTPTILVNGLQYSWTTGDELTSPDRFAQFVQQATAE